MPLKHRRLNEIRLPKATELHPFFQSAHAHFGMRFGRVAGSMPRIFPRRPALAAACGIVQWGAFCLRKQRQEIFFGFPAKCSLQIKNLCYNSKAVQKYGPVAQLGEQLVRKASPVPTKITNIWARSSVGRAFGSHPRGRGFESLRVHQKHRKIDRFCGVLLSFGYFFDNLHFPDFRLKTGKIIEIYLF